MFKNFIFHILCLKSGRAELVWKLLLLIDSEFRKQLTIFNTLKKAVYFLKLFQIFVSSFRVLVRDIKTSYTTFLITVQSCCTLFQMCNLKFKYWMNIALFLPFWTKFDFESICSSAASGEGLRIFALIPPLYQQCSSVWKFINSACLTLKFLFQPNSLPTWP